MSPATDVHEAQMWARIAMKRAILRGDAHGRDICRRYLDRLERMTAR